MTENYDTQLPEAFDPATQKGSEFDVLPIGTYRAQIVDASVAQTQKGDGYYIGLSWQITEGQYEGRYVFQNITFQNPSAQATAIGRAQFKDLCVAAGIDQEVTDVEVFKFIPCTLKVGIEKDKKQGIYPDKNRVSRILPYEAQIKEAAKEPAGAPATAAPKAAEAAATAKAESASQPKAPAASATGANNGSGATAPWRKPKPTLGEDLDDKVPY
jgi:hypothetical protein